MDRLDSRTVLGVTRAAVGAVSLLAPRLSARIFGVVPNRDNGWVTRLFGSRELLLAACLLAARDDTEVRKVASIGAVIDAIDVVSSTAEWRAGRISDYTMVSGGAGAALFAALGIDAARRAGSGTLEL
jgi:hypothetical protein